MRHKSYEYLMEVSAKEFIVIIQRYISSQNFHYENKKQKDTLHELQRCFLFAKLVAM